MTESWGTEPTNNSDDEAIEADRDPEMYPLMDEPAEEPPAAPGTDDIPVLSGHLASTSCGPEAAAAVEGATLDAEGYQEHITLLQHQIRALENLYSTLAMHEYKRLQQPQRSHILAVQQPFLSLGMLWRDVDGCTRLGPSASWRCNLYLTPYKMHNLCDFQAVRPQLSESGAKILLLLRRFLSTLTSSMSA